MYLRLQDYIKTIQQENLSQILSNDDTQRVYAEAAAQEEVESYLKGKYDCTLEFTDTDPFSPTATYSTGSRVEIRGYADYDVTATYTAASKVIVFNGATAYYIKTDSAIPAGVFIPNNWYAIGSKYDLFYISNPYSLFDFYATYKIGDRVFYKGKVYKCLQASGCIDHTTFLNAGTYNNVPPINVFPDDPIGGLSVWGTGVVYGFSGLAPGQTFPIWTSGAYTAGSRVKFLGIIYEALTNNSVTPTANITDWQPETWTKGDNRSQQMVQHCIDIALYHLHSRIAPRNIPELRVKRYDDAKRWLKYANHGEITPKLTLLQPRQGGRIQFGGNTKTTNIY